MSGVAHVTVGPDEAEQRLDRWVRRRCPGLTQGRIEKLCRRGEIRVDGGRAKASTRIGPGAVVRLPPVLEEPSDVSPEVAPPAVDEKAAEDIRASVIHRDDHLLVLNKPAGLAVQGGSGQRLHLGTLLPALRFGRPDDPRLVHRLDKDTSGLLVLARTGAAAVALAKLFRSRAVDKIYLALVAGRVQPAEGTIRTGLVKGSVGEGERMKVLHPGEVREQAGAKHAITDYRVIEQVGGRCAWVALRPVTGRTHQLRAHMAALGCPIAGDGKYGGRSQVNAGDGWGSGLGGAISRKLHLHAAELAFRHPFEPKDLRFRAPLPEHMAKSHDVLGTDAALLSGQLLPD